MLCGLLPPSGGSLRVAGFDLRRAAAPARGHIGYMAQKFSLYGDLSVRENLRFFSSAYGCTARASGRASPGHWTNSSSARSLRRHSGDLPLGYKQRLALACALMHEPDILFLDEPTSGVDPLARREFWRRINALAEAGVTMLVTTHFMEEAEYCDRLVIMAQGASWLRAPPRRSRRAARRGDSRPDDGRRLRRRDRGGRASAGGGVSAGALRRLRGLLRKEFLQIAARSLGARHRLPVAGVLAADFRLRRFARREERAARARRRAARRAAASFAARFAQSPYFRPRQFLDDPTRRPRDGGARGAGHRLAAGRFRPPRGCMAGGAPIGVIVNGVDANNARIVEGYVQQVWSEMARGSAAGDRGRPSPMPVAVEPRVWFNPAVSSRDYLVPGLIAIIMTLTGALLTAMVIAREWERGTMEALMVTRVRIREILLAKLCRISCSGMGGMAASVAMAVWLFGVPLRGSLVAARRRLGSVPAGRARHGAADFQRRAQPVRRRPDRDHHDLPAGVHPVGLPVRHRQHAASAVQLITHLVAARYFVAILQTVFLAGDRVVGDPAQHGGAGGHGGGVPRRRAADAPASGWTDRDVAAGTGADRQGTARRAERRQEPSRADRPAVDPAHRLRLRRDLRSEQRADRRLRRGRQRRLARPGGAVCGSPTFSRMGRAK